MSKSKKKKGTSEESGPYNVEEAKQIGDLSKARRTSAQTQVSSEPPTPTRKPNSKPLKKK